VYQNLQSNDIFDVPLPQSVNEVLF